MIGVLLEQGPSDWEMLQQEDGKASLDLCGSFSVPEAALNVGVDHAIPVIRVLREQDNSQVIPWTPAQYELTDKENFQGRWQITLELPAGGLYRIETGLDSSSIDGVYVWMFRGDVRFHIGVGNLFVIAGQSNASGFGQDWANDEPQLGVHVYRNCSSWNLAAHPLNESTDAGDENANSELRVSGTSPFISFGRNFQKLSGCPVGLIPAAKGGSPIDLWDREGTGTLYRNMLRKISECGGRIAGILWYQGCADTIDDAPAVYEEKYRRFISNVRSDLGWQVPFFTFQTNRELSSVFDEGWGIVREVHRKTASDTPGIYIMPTLNCSLSDDVHNNSGSNVLLGERMAKLCGHVLCGTADFQAPDIVSAVFSADDEVTVTFSNAEHGFVMYRKNASDCGFTLSDSHGSLPLGYACTSPAQPGAIIIKLLRKPAENLEISFCSQAVPTFTPPVSAVTYLPPLAFYRYPVNLQKSEATV